MASTEHLATIAVPAVVIQGADDQLVKPVHGRRLAATLPNARLAIVSGGHMAPYTHPAAVAGAALELARRAALRPRQPARSGA